MENQSIPILEDLSEKDVDLMMAKGYIEALQGNSYDIDAVFEELERIENKKKEKPLYLPLFCFKK